jgi:REP element-mobilizing transposase RayT
MRKWLNHDTPWEVEHPEFFITLCCRPRGSNQLCRQGRAEHALQTAQEFHLKKKWFCSILLLMPDHLHAIVQIPERRRFSLVIGQFKQKTASLAKIRWQRGCFEHRIRHPGSFAEKLAYIQENPVSAGLVSLPEKWPWKWLPSPSPR